MDGNAVNQACCGIMRTVGAAHMLREQVDRTEGETTMNGMDGPSVRESRLAQKWISDYPTNQDLASQNVPHKPTSRYLSHVPIWITSDLPTTQCSLLALLI
jgi:hypothetical protein